MAVVITKPVSGAELKGTVAVEATFSGSNFDIATATLNGQQLASDSALPIALSVDTTKVADGAKTLTVAVRYRAAGGKLRWQKASIPVTIANGVTPPPPGLVVTSSIKDGDTVQQGATWTVTTEPNADLVELYADGTRLVADASEPYQVSVTLPTGAHVLGIATTLGGERVIHTTPGAGGGVYANVTIQGSAPPPPPPPPPPGNDWPPTAQAWKWDDFDPTPEPGKWLYEYLGSNPGFPNPGCTSVSDGEGGRAVRLTVPAGSGGGGVLSCIYDGSAAFAGEGIDQYWRIGVRFVPGYVVPSTWGTAWTFEWHEMLSTDGYGPYSCALGITTAMKMEVQISGGETVGHQYTRFTDPEVHQHDRWYQWDGRILWSSDPAKGKFVVNINGRNVCNISRATLLRKGGVSDKPIIGCYNYSSPRTVDTSVDFRRFAVGPSRASLGFTS